MKIAIALVVLFLISIFWSALYSTYVYNRDGMLKIYAKDESKVDEFKAVCDTFGGIFDHTRYAKDAHTATCLPPGIDRLSPAEILFE